MVHHATKKRRFHYRCYKPDSLRPCVDPPEVVGDIIDDLVWAWVLDVLLADGAAAAYSIDPTAADTDPRLTAELNRVEFEIG